MNVYYKRTTGRKGKSLRIGANFMASGTDPFLSPCKVNSVPRCEREKEFACIDSRTEREKGDAHSWL
jgi:hypothetical protein